MRIVTENVCPPIPIRTHDWLAYVEGAKEWLKGHGSTEALAIQNLIDKISNEGIVD